jgi:hypothetical protein
LKHTCAIRRRWLWRRSGRAFRLRFDAHEPHQEECRQLSRSRPFTDVCVLCLKETVLHAPHATGVSCEPGA